MNPIFRSLKLLDRVFSIESKQRLVVLLVLITFNGFTELLTVFVLFGYIALVANTPFSLPLLSGEIDLLFSSASTLEKALVGGIVLLIAFGIKNLLDLVSRFYLLRIVLKEYQKTSTEMFSRLLKRPYESFLTQSVQESRHALEITMMIFRTVLTSALLFLSDLALFAILVLGLFLFVNAKFVVAILVILGGTQVALLAVTKSLSRNLAVRRERALLAANFVKNDGFRGQIELRLTGRVDELVERFDQMTGEFALTERRVRGIELLPRSLNEVILATAIILAAVYFAVTGQQMVAALPTLSILGFIGLRLTAISSRLSENYQRVRDGEHVQGMFENAFFQPTADPEPRRGSAPTTAGKKVVSLQRALRFDDVTFAYPQSEAPAIRNVSLSVESGSFVGLTGESGSGKSTLALLCMGLLDPQQGSITIDGQDMSDCRESWQRNIGYVGQSPYLSSGTLRENVAFGKRLHEIDDEAIWEVLRMAALDDIVRELPLGLDTPMLDEGSRLSGGQRQRLCIARALYSSPEVLIFDEATSALDVITEQVVSKAISDMKSNRTIVSIAHRLSTIEQCDVVHYLEDGRIRGSGTFDELQRISTGFARLVRGAADDHV